MNFDCLSDEAKRARVLVGDFLYHWSDLELWIGHCLHRIFNLNFVEGSMLTNTMYARDKITALDTAIEYFSRGKMSDQWREEAARKMGALQKFTRSRNTLVHSPFEPTEKGGVEFFRVRTQGKMNQDPEIWTENDFRQKCNTIDLYIHVVMQLTDELLSKKDKEISPRMAGGLLDLTTPLFQENCRDT